MFALDDLRSLLAEMLVANDWQQVVWTDAPADSATTTKTFSFGDPTRGEAIARSSAGGIYVYRWDARFVWHVDPHSETSATAGRQSMDESLDVIRFRSNWPEGVNTLNVAQQSMVRSANDGRTLVAVYRISVQVYEAAPL
jgi:hypothetical protein